MKHIVIILICLLNCMTLTVKSQTNNKNVVYLSTDWKIVTDKKDAVYLYYMDYQNENPKEIYYSNKKRLDYDKSNEIKTTDGIIILNGEYKWYDKNGKLLTHNRFENGVRVWCKTYTWGLSGKNRTGEKLHEYFDYTKKYDNQPNSFYCEQYDKKGNKSTWYLRTGSQCYKYYPASE